MILDATTTVGPDQGKDRSVQRSHLVGCDQCPTCTWSRDNTNVATQLIRQPWLSIESTAMSTTLSGKGSEKS